MIHIYWTRFNYSYYFFGHLLLYILGRNILFHIGAREFSRKHYFRVVLQRENVSYNEEVDKGCLKSNW